MVPKSMKNLKIIHNLHRNLRVVARRSFKGLWMRALFCWMVGLLTLTNDEISSYDWRFQIRGPQVVDPNIVFLNIRPQSLAAYIRNSQYGFFNAKELPDYTDSFYFDPLLLRKIFTEVLRQNPKKIGVLLSFNENLNSSELMASDKKLFQDPKIVWSYDSMRIEGIHRPLFSNDVASNVGHYLLARDSDGIIRRVPSENSSLPHFIEALTERHFSYPAEPFINYRGYGSSAKTVYPTYNFEDLLNQQISATAFQGKWVIISGLTQTNFLTPLGNMTRAEITAQALDTHLHQRWIKRSSFWIYGGLLFILLILSVIIITQYPQRLAFFLLLWLVGLSSSLSLWIFDSFYYWTPIFAPLVQVVTTWIIFVGYMANRLEKQHYELQKEKEYLKELEQLKNNFVSLISHDLKTPIAKIQSILNRLKHKAESEELRTEIHNLQAYSEELNKYIRSIIQLLQVESRDFQLHKEIIDVNDIIKEVIKNLAPLAQEKKINFVEDLEPLFSMEVDKTLIREVLLNLLENAIKYSFENTVITIRSKEVENKVWIEIIDQGEGIGADEVKNVFGKFVRGKTQDLKTKGTGLGLYLVKYFIELHGGEVFLESQLGKGTKVYFSLPVEGDI